MLRNDGATWAIAYARLSDTVFRLSPVGARLLAVSPKYGRQDANCCPSRLSRRTLRFRDGRWVSSVRVVRARG